MTRQTVAAIEAGKSGPSLEAAFRIARVFGAGVEFSCGGAEPRPGPIVGCVHHRHPPGRRPNRLLRRSGTAIRAVRLSLGQAAAFARAHAGHRLPLAGAGVRRRPR